MHDGNINPSPSIFNLIFVESAIINLSLLFAGMFIFPIRFDYPKHMFHLLTHALCLFGQDTKIILFGSF